jgi:hypothetical protein
MSEVQSRESGNKSKNLPVLAIQNLSLVQFSLVTHEQNWSYSYPNARNVHANLWATFHLVAGSYTYIT